MTATIDTIQRIAQIEKDITALKNQRAAEFKALKSTIANVIVSWKKQFPEFPVPDADGKNGIDFNGNPREKIYDNDRLRRIRVEGETLTVCFDETFRGETTDFEITFPVRYLEAGGEAAIRADADALKEAKRLEEAEELRQVG